MDKKFRIAKNKKKKKQEEKLAYVYDFDTRFVLITNEHVTDSFVIITGHYLEAGKEIR